MDDHRSGMFDLEIQRIPTLETERLILRGFRDSDADALHAMTADPVIREHIGYESLPLSEACWRSIAIIVGHWALPGFGMWAVEEKASEAFIGRIGIWRPDGWPGTEVGWLLGRDWWGRGYATEAAHASVAWAFERLDIPELISIIRPDNTRSIRVAERIGERYRGTTPFRGNQASIWAITRDEWEAGRAGHGSGGLG
jgi:RimJ/RimL family protein N-acetyltransferase